MTQKEILRLSIMQTKKKLLSRKKNLLYLSQSDESVEA